jgi:hypothetical protein
MDTPDQHYFFLKVGVDGVYRKLVECIPASDRFQVWNRSSELGAID